MGCKHRKADRRFKTNWRVYNLAMKYEDEWFIKNAKKIIDEMPEPWEVFKRGRPSHPPKALVLALLIKQKHKKTYRSLESFLREEERYKKLGFSRPPSKSTLQEAMVKIPTDYIEKLEQRISNVLKKKNIS